MSLTTTSLSDSLPSSIPKLDSTGLNWAIFSVRFQDAVEAKGFWGHFDGSEPRPEPSPAPPPTETAEGARPAPARVATISAEDLAAQLQWDKNERSAKSLLTQKIPDSTLMRIHSKKTVKERWAAIVEEYTSKGAYAQTDLRQKFMDMKCADKANVREFLDSLQVKREELASVGVDIDEKDYRSTILASLPFALSNFASAQLAAARMWAPTKSIDPDDLISLINEEYDRQKAQRTRRTGAGKSKDRDDDEAMAVNPGSSKETGGRGGRGRGGKSPHFHRKPKGECYNCGEKGHYRNKCPKLAKPSKDTPTTSGSANTAAAADWDSEGEGAWVAIDTDGESVASGGEMPDLESVEASETSSEDGSVPGLATMSMTSGGAPEHDGVSENDSDWFSEVGEDAGELDDEGWYSDDEDALRAYDFPLKDYEIDFSDLPEVALIATEPAKPGQYAYVRRELYDSGCTQHISPYLSDFENFVETPPKAFRAANEQSFSATGKGEMIIDVPDGADSSQLHLTEVLYSPEVGYTLISIGRLDDMGFSATFSGGKCLIQGPDGNRVGEVPKDKRGLYRVQHEHELEEANVAAADALTLDQFHRRMGHISPKIAQKLVDDRMVTGVRLETTPSGDPFFCESCVYAKATRKSIPKEREGKRAKVFGGEVHSDLWGPAPVESKGGKRYYITFTDDRTRLTNLYLLAKKSNAFESYKDYEAWCNTQLDAKVKILHSDRGGEYLGQEFILYLNSKGTKQKLTVHDTPQQNGVAERRNRTIVERIRALLHASGLPKSLWGEAARHVVWLMNRTSTKAVTGQTPYEAAFGKKPDLREVREWGEKVWVRVEEGNKLGGRVREGRWMGLDDQSKGVRVYWPDKRKVSIERNVYVDKTGASNSRLEGEDWDGFIETKLDEPITPKSMAPPKNSEPSLSSDMPPVPAIEDPDSGSDTPIEPVKRPTRTRKPTQKVQDLLAGHAVASERPQGQKAAMHGVQLPPDEPPKPQEPVLEGEGTSEWMMAADFADEYALAAEISEIEALEPRSLAEAKSRPDWPLWEKAIEEELKVLKEAGTWEIVDAPSGANIVGSKWVFRAKKDAAGNVVCYKAQLVAQGFSQVPGVDYFDTFAPVARLASIRAVLAVAAVNDYEIHQIDIKGAYLNGVLTASEVIYMRQPPGYAISGSQGRVCRLKKTLYGLKQSGRRWYQRLVEIMVKFLGFARCDVDQAVFFKREGNSLIIVLVHVDDCTIVAMSQSLIIKFKIEIAKHVGITDLGELHWILGIEVRRVREERIIFLSQRSYLESILRRYGLEELKPVALPMETNMRLTSAQSPSTTEEFARMRNVPYHEAVGSLMYASLGTRPDITYAVQSVSRFSKNPGVAHWDAVKRIFRYLKGTKDLWLSYGGKGKELTGYADADGNMAEDRHAISGYAFILHGGAISWSAKRQEIISLSTTESEYVAATYAAKEALWLRSLLSQLFDTNLEPTTLFSDNQSAIALTKDHQYHARTKHIDIRFHFIRWIVENGSLRLIYCPTEDMVADALTKALPSPKVKHFAKELGLVSI